MEGAGFYVLMGLLVVVVGPLVSIGALMLVAMVERWVKSWGNER